MAQLDYAKEQLGVLKFALGFIAGVFVALCGWLANNYELAKNWLLISCILILVVFAVISSFIMKAMSKKMKEIKEL